MTDTVALIVGYAVAAVIIVQWPIVVRDRKRALMVLHTLCMLAVTGAWLAKGYPFPAIVSAAWLVISVAWYVVAGRQRPGRALDTPQAIDDEPGTTTTD